MGTRDERPPALFGVLLVCYALTAVAIVTAVAGAWIVSAALSVAVLVIWFAVRRYIRDHFGLLICFITAWFVFIISLGQMRN